MDVDHVLRALETAGHRDAVLWHKVTDLVKQALEIVPDTAAGESGRKWRQQHRSDDLVRVEQLRSVIETTSQGVMESVVRTFADLERDV
ncbi:hypothetical protein BMS3Bbin04_01584 [bacterium BMS3Bbin04]|nr:hypothetical protein BMS3Bbin04_01584 [bacterium BMS3Bbin04]